MTGVVKGKSGQIYSARDNGRLAQKWRELSAPDRARMTSTMRAGLAEVGVPPYLLSGCQGDVVWGVAAVLDGCPVYTLPLTVLAYLRSIRSHVEQREDE